MPNQPKNQPEDVKFASCKTLAQRYNLHPKVVQRLGKSGFFPRVRIGEKTVRFPVAECDAVMAANREPLNQG